MGTMKIGILGGAFDPPHLGHMQTAIAASKNFDSVWVMPCYSHVFGKKMEMPYNSQKATYYLSQADFSIVPGLTYTITAKYKGGIVKGASIIPLHVQEIDEAKYSDESANSTNNFEKHWHCSRCSLPFTERYESKTGGLDIRKIMETETKFPTSPSCDEQMKIKIIRDTHST